MIWEKNLVYYLPGPGEPDQGLKLQAVHDGEGGVDIVEFVQRARQKDDVSQNLATHLQGSGEQEQVTNPGLELKTEKESANVFK